MSQDSSLDFRRYFLSEIQTKSEQFDNRTIIDRPKSERVEILSLYYILYFFGKNSFLCFHLNIWISFWIVILTNNLNFCQSRLRDKNNLQIAWVDTFYRFCDWQKNYLWQQWKMVLFASFYVEKIVLANGNVGLLVSRKYLCRGKGLLLNNLETGLYRSCFSLIFINLTKLSQVPSLA